MFKKITRRHLEKFLDRHQSKLRTLDIGSGGSSYHRFFPNRVSVDIDPDRKPDIVADAHSLPFKDSEFELVLCTEVLEHVKNPQKVIDEIGRVLKPGGRVILTTRFVYPLHDTPHDHWRFTKYGLKELFKDWEVIELVGETKNFSTIAALLQRMCFQSDFIFGKPMKFVVLLIAWMLSHLDFLTRKEYGDIKKSKLENDLMPTGYYIVCQKK
jgi:SAM-dependent methyltransferase